MDENVTKVFTPAEPVPAEAPIEVYTAPVSPAPAEAPVVPAGIPQEAPIPPKGKKKLNKKLLIIAVAAALVIALVIGLVSLLGGGTRNSAVFIKDGEICLYIDGMKEPLELSSRLWKDAFSTSQLVANTYRFAANVVVRDNGNLVFYPDKYSDNNSTVTLYCRNANKPDEDPVKIDTQVYSWQVTEDGSQVLYLRYENENFSLHLYDVKREEGTRLAKDISFTHQVAFAEDLSLIYYQCGETVYRWTPQDEEEKITKHASFFRYIPQTDTIFVKTTSGELLLKTSDMEEAEEVADDVSTLLAIYPSGEAYFLRKSTVERCLLDYLDDDMMAQDASLSKPQKPNYPSAPQRVYYWNYATEEEYRAAKEQYDADYAAYQAQYNAMKDAYNEALALYNLKEDRDNIRENLESRVMAYEEYALYYFDGTEEHLLSDSLANSNPDAYSSEVSALVFQAYTPGELVKPKMSEIEDQWDAPYLVQEALQNALYGEKAFYLALGSDTTVIEQTAASNFQVSPDGSAVYFLDVPFEAYKNRDIAYAEAPAAEAEDAQDGEALIPKELREYAALYCISIEDGTPGEPELVDSEVSIHVDYTADKHLRYIKEVDEEDNCGELYVDGQRISDEAYLHTYRYMEDGILFLTDWDKDDACGTLCWVKLGDEDAEVVEIAEDVYSFIVSENGDLFYLQDFSKKRYEGTLFLYDMSKGKAKEIADDVNYLSYIY